MGQNNQKPSADSRGLTEAAVAERQAEAKEIAEFLAGKDPLEPPAQSRYSPITIAPESNGAGASLAHDFVTFLNQTKRVWLIVVGASVGLILVITLLQRGFEWFGNLRERRHEQAVASVTPEHLLARCGQPVEDVTREVYPVLIRTMTYQVRSRETYILEFSRTAEEHSDWVFLSMKDVNGKSYETPEEKVAGMSCLNSQK